MEVTREEDPWHIRPLPRVTSGRACKNRPKSFLRNVISVKDLLLASISPEEFLTQYQVPGHSGASP